MEELNLRLAKHAKEEIKLGERRAELIETLKECLHETTARLNLTEKKVELLEDTCTKLTSDLKSEMEKLEALKKSQTYDPFVLLLIDGNDIQFLDQFVQAGSEGGTIAAQRLRQAVFDYLQSTFQGPPGVKLVIQIYANLEGLARTYVQSQILPDAASFLDFVQGFNKSHAFCDFTDAGDDKEAADLKIKERMDLFYRNMHCKHIILGASGDDGFASFLRKLVPASQVNDRLTLLKSRPFPRNMAKLAMNFKVTSFQEVFVSTDLPDETSEDDEVDQLVDHQPTSASMSAPTITPGPASNPLEADRETPSDDNDIFYDSPDVTRRLTMSFNANGHRIDPKVEYDMKLVKSLRTRNLCFYHYLSRCRNAQCQLTHEENLTREELNALRILARSTPCKSPECRDMYCVAGHHCLFNQNCTQGKKCRFPPEMHHVNTNVVERISEPAQGAESQE